MDTKGNRINYVVGHMNLCIAPPLARAAVILQDETLYRTAAAAIASGLLRTPGTSGKFLAEHLAFFSDFLTAHAAFPKKYQLDFKDDTLLKLALHRQDQCWSMRAPDPGVLVVRLLKDGRHTVCLQRWLWPVAAKLKKPGAGIVIKDSSGKVVGNYSFETDCGPILKKFEVTGKKNDLFEVTIRDYNNADWYILPSETFAVAGKMQQAALRIARNGMCRLYFEVPAGKDVLVTFFGTHRGGFGYWLFDGEDKLQKTEYTWQEDHALSRSPSQVFRIKITRQKKRQIFSIVIWGEMDSRIKLNNSPYISGNRKFFE